MKKLLLLCLSFLLCISTVQANAASDIQVTVNGTLLEMVAPPVVENNRTLLPIRPIAEEMGLVLVWLGEERITSIWNDETMVRLKIDSDTMEVNGQPVKLDTAPVILYDRTYLPVRAVVEAFGATVEWTGTGIDIRYAPGEELLPAGAEMLSDDGELLPVDAEQTPEDEPVADEDKRAVPEIDRSQYVPNDAGKFFFSQPQSDWAFENNGRGYCWVCSYAMLISNVKGEAVTPVDVAAFNMEEGGSGAYMRSHGGIVERFGVEFAPALPETSPYFLKYEDWRGGTYLNVATDEDVVNALKEALDQNPQGVIVRYEGYPHSMVAVGYVNDEIYFYEPAYTDGEWVTFDQTCLKNYNLSDISFIQAIV